jgi:DNA processing protein
MNSRTLSLDEKIAWLRLIRSQNIGPVTLFRLLRQFGNALSALSYIEQLARNNTRAKITVCPESEARAEMDKALKNNIHIIAYPEPEYPELLRHLEDAPPLIYVRGNLAVLKNKCVGIVGARNASLIAKNLAKTIAHDLTQAGICVVSGLARGIDSAAHLGALTNTNPGSPSTIAVLASGVDVVYPPENADLYKQICERGAVISEMPLGTEPMAPLFPRRNRIISGLSLALAVIEAEEKSGSLITARLAAEQGREVFAVPGNPLDIRAKGPNRLLREGANMLESAQDILNNLPNAPNISEPNLFDFADNKIQAQIDTSDIKQKILDNLNFVPCDLDELMTEVAPLNLADFSLAMLELEIEGLVQRQAGNKVVKL